MIAGGLVGAAAILGLRAEEELVTIDFRNHIPGVLDAPVFEADGVTRLESEVFMTQLLILEFEHQGASRYELVATSSLQGPISWRRVFTHTGLGEFGHLISVTNTLTDSPRFFRLRRWR
jgi:hypothetical protein